MQDRSDKIFDQQIRTKFENFASEPDVQVWQQIAEQLDAPRSKRKPYVWLVAASLLLIGAASVWFNVSNSESDYAQLTDQPASKPAVQKAQQAAAPAAVNATTHPVQKTERVASHHPQIKPEVNTETPAPKFVAQNVAKQTTAVVEPAATIAPVETSTMVAALAEPDKESEPLEEDAPKTKTSSLGKLVNFVVSQVDRREDKLIEVSEERGEGLKVLGLNLGLVKMKNKFTK